MFWLKNVLIKVQNRNRNILIKKRNYSNQIEWPLRIEQIIGQKRQTLVQKIEENKLVRPQEQARGQKWINDRQETRLKLLPVFKAAQKT